VRAVNTGVSAFVDASGRVRERGPLIDPEQDDDRAVTILAETALLQPSMFYASVGDTFGWICTVALLVCLWRTRKR
jgi:apolipoprotein N-acyltransferase